MSPGGPDPSGSLPKRTGFKAIATISASDESPSDILSRVLEHEEIGMPLVIRGLKTDPNWSPLPRSDVFEGTDTELQQPGEWEAIAERVFRLKYMSHRIRPRKSVSLDPSTLAHPERAIAPWAERSFSCNVRALRRFAK